MLQLEAEKKQTLEAYLAAVAAAKTATDFNIESEMNRARRRSWKDLYLCRPLNTTVRTCDHSMWLTSASTLQPAWHRSQLCTAPAPRAPGPCVLSSFLMPWPPALAVVSAVRQADRKRVTAFQRVRLSIFKSSDLHRLTLTSLNTWHTTL